MSPEKLIQEAISAQKRAKANYSKYQVGAALLTEENYLT